MQMHEEGGGLLQRDYTNCLAQEFKSTTIQRFCEEISLLIISIYELKSENGIFNQIMNEVVYDLNMFSTRVLNRIFGDVDGTDIVTIYDEMLLTNTIIKKQFLHPKELSATTTYNNVFCHYSGERLFPK